MSDVDKTRMIGLPYGEKNYDKMLSRFHLIRDTGTSRTDRRTDRHTPHDGIARQNFLGKCPHQGEMLITWHSVPESDQIKCKLKFTVVYENTKARLHHVQRPSTASARLLVGAKQHNGCISVIISRTRTGNLTHTCIQNNSTNIRLSNSRTRY